MVVVEVVVVAGIVENSVEEIVGVLELN